MCWDSVFKAQFNFNRTIIKIKVLDVNLSDFEASKIVINSSLKAPPADNLTAGFTAQAHEEEISQLNTLKQNLIDHEGEEHDVAKHQFMPQEEQPDLGLSFESV